MADENITQPKSNMLRIKNLTKVYTSKKGVAVGALNNVSADFGSSGLVFLLGKSGSGKSTMLNVIGGLDKPTSGEIIVKGRSSQSFSESDFDSYRNTYVGFVFQEYNLIDSYTVGVNVGLALELQGKKADRAAVDEMLRKVELVDKSGETLYNRRVNELSGGQRQRVAIARALVKNPEIILADEPTGALDSKTGKKFYELLKELAKDKLIIVVSHDRGNAENYGDRIIELEDGEITSDSAPIELPTGRPVKKAGNDCEFIKSRLPLKRGIVMGAGALKAKTVRLVFSIILSVVTFVIFGFCLTSSAVNELSTELQTVHDNGQSMITLTGRMRKSSGSVISGTKMLTDAQWSELKKYNGGVEPIRIYPNNYYGINNNTNISSYYGYDYLGSQSLRYFAELDPETGEEDAMLTPDARFENKSLCRLPRKLDEIAITDLAADMFIKFGYIEEIEETEEDEENDEGFAEIAWELATRPDPVTIRKPDDLIGRKINNLTITGVYSTEQSIEEYKALDSHPDYRYASSVLYGAQETILTYGFVANGYADLFPVNFPRMSALVKLSGDLGKDGALLDALTYKIEGDVYTSVGINSAYSGLVDEVSFLYHEFFFAGATVMLVIFSIFAIILMSNFLSVSIDFKKKELGILRALGARQRDIAAICLAESLIMAGIQFVISLIVLLLLCLGLNLNFHISIFIVGFWQIAGMLLFIFGITVLATVFPVWRLSKKKPVDVISGK